MKNYEILFPTTLDWKNVIAQAALMLMIIIPVIITMVPGTNRLSIKQRKAILATPFFVLFLVPIAVCVYSINVNDNSYSAPSGDRTIHKSSIIKTLHDKYNLDTDNELIKKNDMYRTYKNTMYFNVKATNKNGQKNDYLVEIRNINNNSLNVFRTNKFALSVKPSPVTNYIMPSK